MIRAGVSALLKGGDENRDMAMVEAAAAAAAAAGIILLVVAAR